MKQIIRKLRIKLATERMASNSNVVVLTSLGLRIFAFICLLISLVVLATNKLLLIDAFKATFSDVHGYRYVVSVATISLSYTILQIGLSIYHLVSRKMIWNGLPEFNLYADQVITWFLASGVGAGFAVTVELQRLVDKIVDGAVGDFADSIPAVDEQKSIVDDFFNKGNTATGILLVAFISMATLLLLSSFNRIRTYKAQVVETKPEEAQDGLETQTVETQAQAGEPPANSSS